MKINKILLSAMFFLLVGCASPATSSSTPTNPATKTPLPTPTVLAPSATPSQTITPTALPSATPTRPILSIIPPGYAIAIAEQKGIFQIPSGSNKPIKLTKANAISLEWSPDGKLLSYGNGAETGIFSIAQNRSIFTPDSSMDAGSWSPDGKQLVYLQHKKNISSLMVYNVQTQTTEILLKDTLSKLKQQNNDVNDYPDSPDLFGAVSIGTFDWSPDGNWIVFSIGGSGTHQYMNRSEIFVLDMTSPKHDIRQLTHYHEDLVATGPKWWDNKTVLYGTTKIGPNSCSKENSFISLLLMPDGGNQPLDGDFKNPCLLEMFYPSPNGRYLAMRNTESQVGIDGLPIYIFDRVSGNIITLSTKSSWMETGLAWSPDSVYLAVPAYNGVRFFDSTQNFAETVNLSADTNTEICPASSYQCLLAFQPQFQPQTAQTPIATLDPNSDCPGAPAARLIIGKLAQVSTVNNTPNRVRKAPEKSAAQLGVLNPGEKMMVLEGPVCSDSHRWWKVQSSVNNSLIGWTVEGDLQNYWLDPIP